MSNRVPYTVPQALDSSGAPIAGAKLHFYENGTTTDQATYSDPALTSANANPVIADSSGRFGDIFLQAISYTEVLKTAGDVQIYSRDDVFPPIANNITYSPPFTGGVDRTIEARLSDSIHAEDFNVSADGSTDDVTKIQSAIDAAELTHSTVTFANQLSAVGSMLTIDEAIVLNGSGLSDDAEDSSGVIVTSDVIGIKSTASRTAMENFSVKCGTDSSTTNPAIQFQNIAGSRLTAVEVRRLSASIKFQDGIDHLSSVHANHYGVISTNATNYNLRVRKDTLTDPSNAFSDFGGLYAGAGVANVEVKDSVGASFFGTTIEKPSGSGIGMDIDTADNICVVGCWLENTTNNLELTNSDWGFYAGGNWADAGFTIKTGSNFNQFYGCRVIGAITIDSGATNTLLVGTNLDGSYSDSGTATQLLMVNQSGVGMRTDLDHRISLNMEQWSGDITALWRSNFARFGIFEDTAQQAGWDWLTDSSRLFLRFATSGGSFTNIIRYEVDGTINPGTTESQDLGSTTREWDNLFVQNAPTVSDERRKNDLGEIKSASEFMRLLDPRIFSYKDTIIPEHEDQIDVAKDGTPVMQTIPEKIIKHGRPHTGLMAQHVKKTMTDVGWGDWCGYRYDEEADKHFLLKDEFWGPMIKAWQEQDKRQDALEARLDSLEE